jgi:hypothetical protein
VIFSRCSCCYPQKPRVRKAVGWFVISYDPEFRKTPIPDFWYVEIGGWPKGNYSSWERAMEAATLYLKREIMP